MHLHLSFACRVVVHLYLIPFLLRSTYATHTSTNLSSLTPELFHIAKASTNQSETSQLTRRKNEDDPSAATRPVWLYFRSPLSDPPDTHPRISVSIGIGAGNVADASAGTLIELDPFQRLIQPTNSSDDSDSSESTIPKHVYQLIFGQFHDPIPGASDAEPVPVAEYTRNHAQITRFYLGKTAMIDHLILDPESGVGALLDAVREQPRIMPVATRSTFMKEVLNNLYVHYTQQYYSDLRNDIHGLFEQAASNDAWSVARGTSPDEIFPTYRIPFILNVKGESPTHVSERRAYVILDIETVDNPGLSWSIRVTPPDRNIYWRVLDYFLHYPDWNGIEHLDEVVAVPGFYESYVK